MKLSSSAFSDGGPIPPRFTCDGEDVSPPLQWSEAPPETKSFALICNDPDAPAGIWHHWVAYDIPVDLSGLPEGAGRPTRGERFKHANNDFGRAGYGGPCPPRGHGPHHYHFRLLALSVTGLEIHKTPSCQDVERAARKHLIAEAGIVGLYHR